MPRQNPYQLLDTIIEAQGDSDDPQQKNYHAAFLIHLLLHMIPIGFLGFDQITTLFFEDRILIQIIILLIVVQFWFTKNITGKRMMGYRWFFGSDQYGQQRLMYQCRANPQYQSSVKPKMFWIIQFVYCIIPFLFIFQAIFLIPNASKIDFSKIKINLCAILSGAANGFYYLRVSGSCSESQNELLTRLGQDGVKKMGLGSIVSFVQ